MAGFNWFQRSYNKSQGSEAEASKEAVTEQKPAETTTEDAQQLSPEDYLKWAKAAYQNIQKRQQEEPTAKAAEPEPAPEPNPEPVPEVPPLDPEPDPEPFPVPAEPEPEPVPEIPPLDPEPDSDPFPVPAVPEPQPVPSTPDAVPEIAPPEPSPPIEPQPFPDPTPIPPLPQPTPSPMPAPMPTPVAAEVMAAATEEVSTPAPPMPFWAKAEAERLERLERLKENAIAAPEPELEPTSRDLATRDFTPTEEPALDLNLDEAFLWSAEVLAGQGRRPDQISLEEITWLNRLRQGLSKTRRSLINQLKAIVGQGPLNQDAVVEIESLLLQADVGVEATDYIIGSLQARLREEALPPDQAIAYLKSILRDMLDKPLEGSHNLVFTPEKDTLNIWLMTGVNGAGKTTTIGKLAHIATKSGYTCLIAAADTFRAAAVEQVKAWGARSDVEVIANPGKNTDPAAVVYDAIAAAQARGADLLLVDTAGRLQNKKNLMDELAKVRRIVDKKAPGANVEALLVLDATLGQNGLRQAEVFSQAANLSGVVLTKLDGTAKGGVALAIVQQLGLPIRFIGAGEGIEDLRPFSSYEFVEALLSG
ncbi:signal recognition particle-docking protein FtsY [Pseudanabaena sp. FACHB-2040]|uniref:signal recognition particle-docking protein FtsY n=1 Tax=Pseudanabaena sp. FACHB-2040 TaxID=2692859 RepID=UPI0016850899|nr:signal recognition particle-docking protein FtsY [Pseudanabaena sp. FACHB-2040]MBD2259117.1 signal recognition particle-docking protein FtsY [Pseudanabaena sp. FACHB-2040]